MTPEERAEIATDELLALLPGARRWAIFEIVLRHIEVTLADAKAEEERVWEETLRLIHRERG